MKFRIVHTFKFLYRIYWFIVTENNENIVIYPCGYHSYFVKVDDFINLKILNNDEIFKTTLIYPYESLIDVKKVTNIDWFPFSYFENIKNDNSYLEFIDKYY
jgi:hypothetical protein